jgi:glycyl-tRNA synthetase beta chain
LADLLIELVSEEIPACMQAGAGHNLARLLERMLSDLSVWSDTSTITGLCASRHLIAYATNIVVSQPDKIVEKRGPRVDAPEAAIAGFLRSAHIKRSALIEKDTP